MIQSTQKIIKIGSSAGVIIPKKQLDALGLKVGDTIKTPKIEPAGKSLKNYSKELDDFMDEYQQDLKNLASR